MANDLTGAYEAVVQISARQINGLLATLHQNGASDDAPLKLAHSTSLRVGDPRKSPADEPRLHFRDWLRNFQAGGASVGVDNVRARLAATAPPGAARTIESEFSKVGKVKPGKEKPRTVRGLVKLQVSSPTISLANGSTSEVTFHARVRAHYSPDAGAGDVAAPVHPVHGEVRAVFELRLLSSGGGRKLHVQPSSRDSKIQFIAAQGTHLTATEVSRISAEVRKVIRESFTPQPVDLPPDFPFSEFKALGSGTGQAIALPVQLSGASLPGGHLHSVSHRFIGSSGFAVAASKEYVQGLLDPLFDSVRDAVANFKRHVTIGVRPFTTRINFRLQLKSGPSLTWKSGHVELSARLKLIVKPGPDVSFKFKQSLALALHEPTQTVTLTPVGDPEVDTDLPFNFLHDAFENEIKGARDQALSGGVNDMVNDTFHGAKITLVNGLKSFDDSASATFTEIEITADGVIVRGEIGGAARRAPVVQIAETDEGRAFSALASWIPGGRIHRLIWSWEENSGHTPKFLSGMTKFFADEHRFIFAKPSGIKELGSVCLRIEGTQTNADGRVVSVAGESACYVRNSFGPIIDAPSWWEPVVVPIWMPDSKPGATLGDSIAGHITLQSDTPQKNELTHNSLVYFPNWRADKPMDLLERALAAMKRQKVSLVLIVVLPNGAFKRPRRDAEAKLTGLADRFAGRLLLTEDHEGGWKRTFDTSKLPSAYLVNALREFVWKQEGAGDPKVMAAALDKFILPAPAPRSRPLRLAVPQGCNCRNRAPDITFDDDRGVQLALHRLFGREVMLNFWQAWSAPCITELRRLQELHKQGGRCAPFIVGFHGGKERKVIAEIRKKLKLTFPLAQDNDQRIARMFGVRCWPTTISINAEGFIANVQFGIPHGRAKLTKAAKRNLFKSQTPTLRQGRRYRHGRRLGADVDVGTSRQPR